MQGPGTVGMQLRLPRAVPYLIIFVLCIVLYTKDNDFARFYHPDEIRKVQYVLEGKNRFFHPLLMSGTARVFSLLLDIQDKDDAAEMGRNVSAVFAALAVLCLMGIAQRLRGAMAAWVVGLSVGSSWLLLLLAHYFKEDPALLLGICATLLALTLYCQNPTARHLAGIGIGCALAISGKYAGALILLPALGVVLLYRPNRSGGEFTPVPPIRRLLFWCAGFFPTVLLINFPMLLEYERFLGGLRSEIHHVSSGHYGLVAAGFGRFYGKVLIQELSWPVVVLAGTYAVLLVVGWRRRTLPEWLMLGFPFYWFLAMERSDVQMTRYLLPVIVVLHFWAGMAIMEISTLLSRRPRLRMSAAVLLLLPVVGLNGLRIQDYLKQFDDDSRRILARWARNHLSADDYVLEDLHSRLESHQDLWPKKLQFRISNPRFAAEVGSLQEARLAGFTHVAVCELSYGRFFEPGYRGATPQDEALRRAHRQFYEELFRSGKLLWKHEPRYNMRGFTNPPLYLFEIR